VRDGSHVKLTQTERELSLMGVFNYDNLVFISRKMYSSCSRSAVLICLASPTGQWSSLSIRRLLIQRCRRRPRRNPVQTQAPWSDAAEHTHTHTHTHYPVASQTHTHTRGYNVTSIAKAKHGNLSGKRQTVAAQCEKALASSPCCNRSHQYMNFKPSTGTGGVSPDDNTTVTLYLVYETSGPTQAVNSPEKTPEIYFFTEYIQLLNYYFVSSEI